MGHQLPNFFSNKLEKIDNMLRSTRELLSKLFLLTGHSNGAGVEMAHTGHNAALGNHCDGTKAELFCAHHGSDGNVPPSADASINAYSDAITETIVEKGGMCLSKTELPWTACVLDRRKWRSTGPTVSARNLDNIGIGLGNAASNGANSNGRNQLDRNSRFLIDGVEIMDELGEILLRKMDKNYTKSKLRKANCHPS